MQIIQYFEQARSTAIYPGEFDYPVHGIAGECGELIDKTTSLVINPENRDAVIKELGDVMWYIASVAYDAKITPVRLVDLLTRGQRADTFTELGRLICYESDHRSTLVKLPIFTGRLNEIAKKMIRDSGGELPVHKVTTVEECLCEVLVCLYDIARKWSVSLDEVATANAEKLASRKERGTLQGSGDNR